VVAVHGFDHRVLSSVVGGFRKKNYSSARPAGAIVNSCALTRTMNGCAVVDLPGIPSEEEVNQVNGQSMRGAPQAKTGGY
jgi:hypothetical protein